MASVPTKKIDRSQKRGGQAVATPWSFTANGVGAALESGDGNGASAVVIGFTRKMPKADYKANAALIVEAANNYHATRALMSQLINAIELCLENNALKPEIESVARLAVARAQR